MQGGGLCSLLPPAPPIPLPMPCCYIIFKLSMVLCVFSLKTFQSKVMAFFAHHRSLENFIHSVIAQLMHHHKLQNNYKEDSVKLYIPGTPHIQNQCCVQNETTCTWQNVAKPVLVYDTLPPLYLPLSLALVCTPEADVAWECAVIRGRI